MTKIELIKEMYNVIINNADVFNYPEKHMTEYYADKVKTTKKAELEQWLAKLNAMVEEAKKEETIETVETEVETVETEVENDTEKDIEDMTKEEIINKINKFMDDLCGLNYYFHYFNFMEGENITKNQLNCAVIGDDGIMYYRYFGDNDRIHFKKLKNCTKAELITIVNVCQLYIAHLKTENERMKVA